MKVSYEERCELIEFILDMHADSCYKKELTACFDMLKVHQTHKQPVKIHNKVLKEFIEEVRSL